MRESNHRDRPADAAVEQPAGHAPFPAKEMPRFDSPVRIVVTSYRSHNHDPDGVSVKALLDGLVQAGILRDDSTKQVESVTLQSIKCKTGEEKTILEIDDGRSDT